MGYGEDLYRANTRDGGIYFSGNPNNEYELANLLRYMPIEFERQRQARTWCLNPAEMASPQIGADLQSMPVGLGMRIGNNSSDEPLRAASGPQEDGTYKITTSTTQGQIVNMSGPNSFGPTADTVLKFYSHFKINDIDKTDFAIGLATENLGISAVSDFLASADGEPGGDLTDAVIFHWADDDTATSITFSIYDGASNTNSTESITLPASFADDTYIELGFVIIGITDVRVFARMAGYDPTVTRFDVDSDTLALCTASLQRMGPMFSMRQAAVSGWQIVTFKPSGLSVMQTL